MRVKAKANLVTSTGGSKPRPLQNSVKADTVNTQKELETASGISHDTIARGKVIQAKASEKPSRGAVVVSVPAQQPLTIPIGPPAVVLF